MNADMIIKEKISVMISVDRRLSSYKLRRIEHELPKKVFEQAEEKYSDRETGHLIAVMNVDLYDKNREVMVAYVVQKDCAKLLTIHPLKEGQKENRINAGRWRKI
ncbi:MAG: hypothetical protein Q8O04_03500 [Deltaproteobacteria bacterium]|nr:hypothetical protein [Deltaproteobacteria bacterium]